MFSVTRYGCPCKKSRCKAVSGGLHGWNHLCFRAAGSSLYERTRRAGPRLAVVVTGSQRRRNLASAGPRIVGPHPQSLGNSSNHRAGEIERIGRGRPVQHPRKPWPKKCVIPTARPRRFKSRRPRRPLTAVAYFSMEYGLTEALPIYPRGLGMVAGDYLKAADDLGVPVVGIGLPVPAGLLPSGRWPRAATRGRSIRSTIPASCPSGRCATPGGMGECAIPFPGRLARARVGGEGRPGDALPARRQRP